MEFHPYELFTFSVDIHELRIICKALGGRLKEEDVAAAEALDLAIARSRIAHGEQRYGELMKLKANLPTEP